MSEQSVEPGPGAWDSGGSSEGRTVPGNLAVMPQLPGEMPVSGLDTPSDQAAGADSPGAGSPPPLDQQQP